MIQVTFNPADPKDRADVRQLLSAFPDDATEPDAKDVGVALGEYPDKLADAMEHAARNAKDTPPLPNRAKLTPDQVREIRADATTPDKIREFAMKYGVTYPAIKYIVDRKSYKWVQ